MTTVRRGRPAGRRPGPVVGELDPQSAALLTVSRGHPCISVLMATTPGPQMTAADAGRLAGLVHEAGRRLEEQGVVSAARLVSELEHLARVARHSRTGHGLGLFVNLGMARGWTLPAPVPERVVVESTFATRDLLLALHRTPPHLVVRLDPFGARMFWVAGRARSLGRVERLPTGADRLDVAAEASAAEASASEELSDFLARVDATLARRRQERPAPLVLAGDPALVAELKARSRWLDRLAGEVHDPEAAEPGTLFRAAAARLEDYLHRRGEQTLADLHEAAASAGRRVVRGLDDCWAAVATGTPGTVVVEDGYVHPRPPGRPGGPPTHDAVDDLLELALERGNLIAFVGDGRLAEYGGIALLRPGR